MPPRRRSHDLAGQEPSRSLAFNPETVCAIGPRLYVSASFLRLARRGGTNVDDMPANVAQCVEMLFDGKQIVRLGKARY